MPSKIQTRAQHILKVHPTVSCVYVDPLGNVFLPHNLPDALSLWGGDASQLQCITRPQRKQKKT